jgi:hypothetical protein
VPKHAARWAQAGLANIADGKREAAEENVRLALALAPADAEVLATCARLHDELERQLIAEELNVKAVIADPANAAARRALAEFYHRHDRSAEADDLLYRLRSFDLVSLQTCAT